MSHARLERVCRVLINSRLMAYTFLNPATATQTSVFFQSTKTRTTLGIILHSFAVRQRLGTDRLTVAAS